VSRDWLASSAVDASKMSLAPSFLISSALVRKRHRRSPHGMTEHTPNDDAQPVTWTAAVKQQALYAKTIVLIIEN